MVSVLRTGMAQENDIKQGVYRHDPKGQCAQPRRASDAADLTRVIHRHSRTLHCKVIMAQRKRYTAAHRSGRAHKAGSLHGPVTGSKL